jgi:hypothetical protein
MTRGLKFGYSGDSLLNDVPTSKFSASEVKDEKLG